MLALRLVYRERAIPLTWVCYRPGEAPAPLSELVAALVTEVAAWVPAGTRVVLLTNNPTKVDGLANAGIEITGRMPIETPVNSDNRRYLTAKASRAGHQLGHVIASMTDDDQEARLVP